MARPWPFALAPGPGKRLAGAHVGRQDRTDRGGWFPQRVVVGPNRDGRPFDGCREGFAVRMRSRFAAVAVVCLTLLLWALAAGKVQASARGTKTAVSLKSQDCVACHQGQSPGIVEQWRSSEHARRGVGCWECHRAEKGDADAFDHGGTLIATIVSPRDCARCHRQQNDEFQPSHHAKAGNILASLDNYLAEVVEAVREAAGREVNSRLAVG